MRVRLGLPAFPAMARPVRHDPSPSGKWRVRKDDGGLAGDSVGDQSLPGGAHGVQITARRDPVRMRDFTGMMKQIAEDVTGRGAALDPHDAMARRLPRSRNHRHTRHHLVLAVHKRKQAEPIERSEMECQCRVRARAIGVPLPIMASNEVLGARKAGNTATITHDSHAGIVIIVGMGDQNMRDHVRLHADRS